MYTNFNEQYDTKSSGGIVGKPGGKGDAIIRSIPWPQRFRVVPARQSAFPLSRFVILWLVALLPRLVVAGIFFQFPIALDDMFQYDMLARSLASGHGYRWYTPADVETLRPYLQQVLDLSKVNPPPDGFITTFRPPGYPFFLAGLYELVPEPFRLGYVRIVQAFVMALMAPLAALLGLRIGLRPRTALLAGLAMAFYPILLFYPAGLASENTFIPLLLLGFLLLLGIRQQPWFWKTLLAGLVLGLAMLTRSVLAAFVLLAGLWAWRYSPGRKRAALVLVATAFGVCLPWAIRNSIVMGKPTFVESALGFQLYIGYHPAGDGGFESMIAIPPMAILNDAQRDQYTMSQALRFIKADPAGALVRIVRRSAYFVAVEDRELTYFYGNGFFGDVPQPWLGLAYLLIITPWIGVGLLSIPGLRLAANRAAAWLGLALIVGYTLPHLFIIAEPRFHLALVPILIPFAFSTLDQPRAAIRLLFRDRSWKAWLIRASLIIFIGLVTWAFALHWERILTVMGPDGFRARLYY